TAPATTRRTIRPPSTGRAIPPRAPPTTGRATMPRTITEPTALERQLRRDHPCEVPAPPRYRDGSAMNKSQVRRADGDAGPFEVRPEGRGGRGEVGGGRVAPGGR